MTERKPWTIAKEKDLSYCEEKSFFILQMSKHSRQQQL